MNRVDSLYFRWATEAPYVRIAKLLEPMLAKQYCAFVDKNDLRRVWPNRRCNWYESYSPYQYDYYLEINQYIEEHALKCVCEASGVERIDLRGFNSPKTALGGVILRDADLSYVNVDTERLADIPAYMGRPLKPGIDQNGFFLSILENCVFMMNDLSGISGMGHYNKSNHYTKVSLDKATVSCTCFEDCVFRDCRFRKMAECSMLAVNCVFERCDFSNTLFGWCKLVNVQFKNCVFRKARFNRQGVYQNCGFVECKIKELGGEGFLPEG